MCIKDQYEFKSRDVARVIIAELNRRRFGVSNDRVQCLLYIAYGLWLLALKYRLTDERPEAWRQGPVFSAVQHELADKTEAQLAQIDDDDLPPTIRQNADLRKVIDLVMEDFGDWPDTALKMWNVRDCTPWWQFIFHTDRWERQPIPDSSTYEFFASLYNYEPNQ